MRFIAPEHTSGVTLSIGPVDVVDGAIDVQDDLGEGDRAGLAANGFLPAPIVASAPEHEA